VPEFDYTVVEEDERTVTYINHEGILMREFKQHRDTSMPQFIKFPVENEQDFEKLRAERLVLNPEQRLSREWREHVAADGVAGRVNEDLLRADALVNRAGTQDDPPRQCWADRWGGYFGSIRNMMGVGICVGRSTISRSCWNASWKNAPKR
jgi:uroporphyrinogen decarboxylase